MPHSDDLTDWTDEIPSLHDLDGRGGRPGCEYLYCDSAHEREAQQAGWTRKGPVFQLTGPAGTCPFVVMERGEPVRGLDPHSTSQPLSISLHLTAATGLGPQALRKSPDTAGAPLAAPPTAPIPTPKAAAAVTPANLPTV